MREIKFRGKRVNDGEWVFGFLSKGRLEGYKGNTLQPCVDREENGVMISSVVDPETIGQYTGLKDKNGKEIYEGDIIYSHHAGDTKAGPVVFSDIHHSYIIDYPPKNGRQQWQLMHGKEHCYEVIGNIYDNPEKA